MILKNNIYNIEETLSKFPRAKDKLDKWYLDKVFDLQLGVAKEAKQEIEFRELFEANKEQVRMGVLPYFTYNARDLYEFFDDNSIKICVEPFGDKNWTVYINFKEVESLPDYTERWNAEKAAFDNSFENLESKFN